jgi:hypothetical protein
MGGRVTLSESVARFFLSGAKPSKLRSKEASRARVEKAGQGSERGWNPRWLRSAMLAQPPMKATRAPRTATKSWLG